MATAIFPEQHVALLKNKRRAFRTQITLVTKHVNEYVDTPSERAKLRDRMSRLRAQFDRFNDIQDELGLVEDYDTVEAEREATSEQYAEVAARASVLLAGWERVAAPPISRSANDTPASILSATPVGIHLPKIDLPKFDGRLEKWTNFKDAFQTMIHTHTGLSEIQKLHYLRLSLSGKAQEAIESFTISEDNYKAAWDQLNETYDNTRALVLRHADLLSATPKMPDDSAESSRDLVNHMQSHLRSLQALGRSDQQIKNDLLVSIAVSKLDINTYKAWEQTLTGTEMPKIEDIFRYLRNASHRCKVSEDTTASNHASRQARTTSPRPKAQRGQPPRSPKLPRRTPTSPLSSISTARKEIRQVYATATAPTCKFCKTGNHQEFRCTTFLEWTPDARLQAARKASLCLNCLRADHPTEKCTAGGCRICGKRHNTRLHRKTDPRKMDGDTASSSDHIA